MVYVAKYAIFLPSTAPFAGGPRQQSGGIRGFAEIHRCRTLKVSISYRSDEWSDIQLQSLVFCGFYSPSIEKLGAHIHFGTVALILSASK